MDTTKYKYDCHNCLHGDTKGTPCKQCIRDNNVDSKPTAWTPKQDMVNKPAHYQSKFGLEVIDVIEAFTANLNGIEAVSTGNVIKYICRWNKKSGLEDLKKAQWYLNHLIKHIENNDKKENM